MMEWWKGGLNYLSATTGIAYFWSSKVTELQVPSPQLHWVNLVFG
jgi:ABC-type phosphate transport system auxiliary subunit